MIQGSRSKFAFSLKSVSCVLWYSPGSRFIRILLFRNDLQVMFLFISAVFFSQKLLPDFVYCIWCVINWPEGRYYCILEAVRAVVSSDWPDWDVVQSNSPLSYSSWNPCGRSAFETFQYNFFITSNFSERIAAVARQKGRRAPTSDIWYVAFSARFSQTQSRNNLHVVAFSLRSTRQTASRLFSSGADADASRLCVCRVCEWKVKPAKFWSRLEMSCFPLSVDHNDRVSSLNWSRLFCHEHRVNTGG